MARTFTQMNPGVGGDQIIDESIGVQKMPLSKIVIGADGTDGGDVHVGNPLPIRVSDGVAFVDIGATLASILTALLAQSTAASIATQAATAHADSAALLAAVGALATQATLVTASITLTSILAKIIAGPATEATLAAAKADLDTLNTTVATAAAQATGNATLATLSTNLAALVAVNHTDLGQLHTDLGTINTTAGTLATAAAQSTGNTSLASIKTDLDTLVTNIGTLHADVSTAAKQDTGNTALATLHTDLGTVHADLGTINTSVNALVTADHTDLLSLAAKLDTTHTDLAAILAKQPSAPALDRTTAAAPGSVELSDGAAFYTAAKTGQFPSTLVGGRLDVNIGASATLTEANSAAIASSVATVATQTTTTATQTTNVAATLVSILADTSDIETDLDTIASAVAVQNGALSNDVVMTGGVGTASAPSSVTDGNAVRAWFTRFGAAMSLLLGKDGATAASASNGVPVAPETSSLWDVKDRAARLIGAITGTNASGVASPSNPLDVQPGTSTLWDVKDRAARLVGAITGSNASGVASPSNPLDVQPGTSTLWDVKDRAARLLGALTGINASAVASVSNPVPVQIATTYVTAATLAVAGVLVKTGAGTAVAVEAKNATGATVFFQVHDRTTTPGNGRQAEYYAVASSTSGGAGALTNIGNATVGAPFTTGFWFVLSSTQDTYTAHAGTTAYEYTIIYQ